MACLGLRPLSRVHLHAPLAPQSIRPDNGRHREILSDVPGLPEGSCSARRLGKRAGLMKRSPKTWRLSELHALLQSEIVQVTGCTEPATVAYALLTARRHLKDPFDPSTARVVLTATPEVLRNAGTAVVPFLNRRGLRVVAAAGLASTAKGYDLFPFVDRRIIRRLLRRKSWLDVRRTAARKGVYVRALLSMPTESVSVVISGRHDEIRAVDRNGISLFRSTSRRPRAPDIAEIMSIVAKRDRPLENLARDFIVRQVRGDLARPLPQRVAALIRDRMCGSPSAVMTVVGSGNHGILLGVPFYELYLKRGRRALLAALFSILAVIHMTAKRSRISKECGLGTKAGPALAAGLAYAQGATEAEIVHRMRATSRALCRLECHGARASCGRKSMQVINTVLREGRT